MVDNLVAAIVKSNDKNVIYKVRGGSGKVIAGSRVFVVVIVIASTAHET